MNPNHSSSESENFRIVDLFSPGEDVGSSDPDKCSGTLHDRPVSIEMPGSFIYMNPFLSSKASAAVGERV